jgi:hypothetical protein
MIGQSEEIAAAAVKPILRVTDIAVVVVADADAAVRIMGVEITSNTFTHTRCK